MVSFTVTFSRGSFPVLVTVMLHVTSSPTSAFGVQVLLTSMPGSWTMSVLQESWSDTFCSESAPVPAAVTTLCTGSESLEVTVYSNSFVSL